MKSAYVSVSLLMATLGLIITCLPELSFVEGQVKDRPCKSIMSDITKRQFAGIALCTKTLKFKNGKDKAKKMNCIMKCAMSTEGLLTKEGDITQDNTNIILGREFGPALIDRANETFRPCVEKYEGTLDGNEATDPYCTTYDPVVKCLLAKLPTLCPK